MAGDPLATRVNPLDRPGGAPSTPTGSHGIRLPRDVLRRPSSRRPHSGTTRARAGPLPGGPAQGGVTSRRGHSWAGPLPGGSTSGAAASGGPAPGRGIRTGPLPGGAISGQARSRAGPLPGGAASGQGQSLAGPVLGRPASWRVHVWRGRIRVGPLPGGATPASGRGHSRAGPHPNGSTPGRAAARGGALPGGALSGGAAIPRCVGLRGRAPWCSRRWGRQSWVRGGGAGCSGGCPRSDSGAGGSGRRVAFGPRPVTCDTHRLALAPTAHVRARTAVLGGARGGLGRRTAAAPP